MWGLWEKCSPSAESREVIPEELSHQPKAQLPPSFPIPFTSLSSPLLKANLCVCVCLCVCLCVWFVRERECVHAVVHTSRTPDSVCPSPSSACVSLLRGPD